MKLPQIFYFLRLKPVVVRRVVGSSMTPSLLPGTLVVAVCVCRPRPGRIIVFTHQGVEKIKRVQQVDAQYVYVVGDNTAGSTDSRDFGWIDNRSVIGTVVWPRIRKLQ